MALKKTEVFFLNLLQCSINKNFIYREWDILSSEEWYEVFSLAEQHGLVSLLIDVLDKIHLRQRPPKQLLLNWIGQAAKREGICKNQFQLSCEFAEYLNKEGVKCIVLKGLALASYYPNFSKREFGDLDCFLIKDCQPAASIGNNLANRLQWIVEEAGYKHTHIHYKNLLIENHLYLTNFNGTKQGFKIEKQLRQLVLDGKERNIGDTNLWIPSPEFNVLFLLKHALGDFIANDMSIRTLYDWAVFLQAEQNHIEWTRMSHLLEECRLRNFFNLLTTACVTYLGLEIKTDLLYVPSEQEMVICMIQDLLHKPNINSGHLKFKQKIPNIINRFKRQFKYRSIETESVVTLIWNTIAFSSYFKRHIHNIVQ